MGMKDLGHALKIRVKKYPKPDKEEMHRIYKRMLRHPEKLKETGMRLTYNYSTYKSILQAALLSCKVKEGVSRSNLEELFFLSRFSPYKLFVHVFYEKTGVRLFGSGDTTVVSRI